MCKEVHVTVDEKPKMPHIGVKSDGFGQQESFKWMHVIVRRRDGKRSGVCIPFEREFLSEDAWERHVSDAMKTLAEHCREGMECSAG